MGLTPREAVSTAPILALGLIYIRSYVWGSLAYHMDKCYCISGGKVSSDRCQAHNVFRISAQVSTCFPWHRFTLSLNAYVSTSTITLTGPSVCMPAAWSSVGVGPAWTRQLLAHGPVCCNSGGNTPATVSDDHTFGSLLCVFFLRSIQGTF